MNSVQSVTYELPAERYYAEHLTRKDAAEVRPLVDSLGNELTRNGSPSLILAVGSATFPKDFWIERRRQRKKNQSMPIRYSGIDLNVVPVNPTGRDEMVLQIRRALDQQSVAHYENIYPVELRTVVSGSRGRPLIFPHFDYDSKSIIVPLATERKLEIILRGDDLQMGAEQKIVAERSGTCPFAVLYLPEQLRNLAAA